MTCTHARKLFAAFWDDETTQAEREWLESHFTACDSCRLEYEGYARTLEIVASMPRVEPAPGLPERVLQRVRRAESVPDRMPVRSSLWVPVGSAVAVGLLIALTFAGPWLGAQRASNSTVRGFSPGAVTEPVAVHLADRGSEPRQVSTGSPLAGVVAATLSAGDSLFDHTEDVEFILDPVTLHRGRASVNRTVGARQGEKAVITF